MTSNEKIKYLNSITNLVVLAEDYRTALVHYNYVRGVANAWYIDMTLVQEAYDTAIEHLEEAMAPKYELKGVYL